MIKGILDINGSSFNFVLDIWVSRCYLEDYLIETVVPYWRSLRARLSGWKSSLLSYAGHLELIGSTLTALHIC